MTRPALSVIVVTYNSVTTIERCLSRLERAVDTLEESVEILIWDNASSDDTIERIRSHPLAAAGRIDLIASTDNLGFGGGNNAAAQRATGDVLLLLNPDAYLDDPASLAELLAAKRAGRAGIVGPYLENADGTHQIGDAGYAETLTIAGLWAFGLDRLPGAPGPYLSRDCPPATPPFAIDWVCGACLIIDHALFRALGGFDVRIFLYSEDVDLCLRARRAGADVLYVPSIRVAHVQGVSSAGKGVSTTWLNSRFELFERAHGTPVARPLFAAMLAIGFGWRAAVYRLAGRGVGKAAATQKAHRMQVYAHFAAGRILRNRPTS